MAGGYALIFCSPAHRAAETVAWMLRARGEQLPPHEVVPGLGGKGVEDTPQTLGDVVRELIQQVPEGGRGLAIGHTPLIEKAVLGLTGAEIAPLAESEGVLLTQDADGTISVEELRV